MISRSYQDFSKLHSKLRKVLNDGNNNLILPKFPPPRYFGVLSKFFFFFFHFSYFFHSNFNKQIDEEFIAKRWKALYEYLLELASTPEVVGAKPFKIFLIE